jgi:hypothetical protein
MYSTPNLITSAGSVAETRPNRSAVSIRTQTSVYAVCASAAVFLLALLLLNRDLFRHPSYEWGDYAANAIQIQNAKHFHELLGNYSRWGFHHPGPGFFYLFAAGELVFHNWLHMVPEAMNAYILTILLANVAALFASIWVVAQHTRSALFLPAAILSSLVFIHVIDRTLFLIDTSQNSIPQTALGSVWMPYVVLFGFLFYMLSCAALACGNIRYLPGATFAGLMLLHAHVAQVLFVGVLAVMAAASWIWRGRCEGSLPARLKLCRRELLVSAGLVMVFATPIVTELIAHKPNNLHAIRKYMHEQPAFSNSLAQALGYELGFYTFLRDPEVVLVQPSPKLLARAMAEPYVVKYWMFVAVLVGLLIALRVRGRRLADSPFVCYMALELVVVSILFLYWAMKMAGGMANFNGYFYYSVQLLGLFAICSVIVDSIPTGGARLQSASFAMACALPLLIFAAPHSFKVDLRGGEEANRIALAAAGRAAMLQLVFDHDDWPTAVGIASRLKRLHQPFCIIGNWSVMFGADAICREASGVTRLILSRKQSNCASPCLLGDGNYAVELSPMPALRVPFTLGPDGSSGFYEGFYSAAIPGAPIFTSERSTIRFVLGGVAQPDDPLRVLVTGTAIPGRPADIFLNGSKLGTIVSSQRGAGTFRVPGSLLKFGSDNVFSIYVANAAPVGKDLRHLGYCLESIQVSPVNPR